MATSTPPPQYCLLNWGRLNAFPLNYTSAHLFGSIGNVVLDPKVQSVLIASLSVSDRLNEEPNTLVATVRGTKPREGQAVQFRIGSQNAYPLFVGTILRVTQMWAADNPKNILCQIEATDPTWRLNEVLVTARYQTKSASFIALDLLARFAPAGLYNGQIEPGLPVLDEITFTNTKLMDALGQLANRIGGYVLCDYLNQIRLFTGEAFAPPLALTATHPSVAHVQYTRDLTQIVTRAIVQGGGANALARLPAGATELPVEDAAWYSPSGGLVASGPQRIAYTGVRLGGAGSLTGAGGTPTSAPTLTPTAGGSVTVGGHGYAYSYVSAQGETLAGPPAFVTMTSGGPVAVAPTIAVGEGSGLPLGVYIYGVSHVLASGETGVVSAGLTTCGGWSAANDPQNTTSGLRTVQGSSNLGSVGDRIVCRQCWRQTTAQSPATLGATSAQLTLVQGTGAAGTPCAVLADMNYGTPVGSTAHYVDIQIQNVTKGGAWQTVLTYPSAQYPYPTTFTLTTVNFSSAATETPGGLPKAKVTVTVNDGGAGVTARRVYRTKKGGGPLYFLKQVSGSTATAFVDTAADSTLVDVAPAGSGALNTVTLSGITPGSTSGGGGGTTKRKIYRTPADSGYLKLLATINDNTTTTFVDTQPDSVLGADIPTADTSGLIPQTGETLAGATSLPVSGTGPFPATGGWVLSGNNRIRYTGVSATALTGIPASGEGAIGTTIPHGTPATLAPSLTGIPGAGTAGAIVWPIPSGEPVDIVVIVDDLNAQATLQALLGGGATGIREALIQDGRIGIKEATARGRALLQLQSTVLESLRHRARDPGTIAGALVTVNLPAPTSIAGTYRIQDVTVSSFNPHAGIFPAYDATSSSSRYTLEDLLRQLSRTDPPPTTGETP